MSSLKYNIVHGKKIGTDKDDKAIYKNTKCGAIIETNGRLILVMDYMPTGDNLVFSIFEPKAKEEKSL